MSFTKFQNSVLATDNFVLEGGIKVLITAASVEIATLVVGTLYVVTAIGGPALLRQSTDAAVSSNANFDVCIPDGGMARFRAIDTILNVIEADVTSSATAAIYIAEIDESQNNL